MDKKNKAVKIVKVLLDRGETQFGTKKGETLDSLLDTGARMMDNICLNDWIVVLGSDGRHYIGEFEFRLRKISTAAAEKLVAEAKEDDLGYEE